MLYAYPKFGSILFVPKVINIFLKHQQKQMDTKEAGGYLFGRFFRNQVVIEIATEPDENDFRSRCFIFRNKIKANKLFSKLWSQTNGELFLAGEWHTHPEKKPNPSSYDRKESLRSFKKNTYPLNFMSVVIIGNGSISESWIGIRNDHGLVRLKRGGHKLWNC